MKSVFVSSTFRDMNFERDVLNTRVAPKINYQLAKYNQSMRIVDLRWGVDTTDMTEQEASSRVLSACFDSIEECKPYIIVLIGDRYGYIPDDHDISVTHMEIIRGVFESSGGDHVYIYFRDGDYTGAPEAAMETYVEQNEASRSRLEELKEKLRLEFPGCCKQYKSRWSAEDNCMVSDELEDMIVADLEDDLIRENEGICYRSDLHKQMCENEELLSDRVRFAYSNEKKIKADIEAIERFDIPYGIIGDGGTGKSIYMSLLCSALREKGHKAHVLFCGDNAFSASVRSAAEMVLYILSDALGEDYQYEEYAALTYDEIIARIIEKRDLVKEKHFLLLDAIDKCDHGMVNFVYWCKSFLSKHIKIVFSSRMIAEIEEQKDSFEIVNMSHDRDDFREMIRCILNQYAKSMSDMHVEHLLDKTTTPLQLHLLLRRLLNLRSSDYDAIQKLGKGIDAINTYLKQVIDESPAEMDELISQYLQGLFDESKNPSFAACILSFLSYCEYGLQEDDLRELFSLLNSVKWVSLDYIEFLQQFSFFVRVRDNGRLDISHDVIRQTLCMLFKDNERGLCSLIAMYMLHRKKQDSIAIRTFLDVAFKGGQCKRFAEFVIKFKDVLSSNESEYKYLASEIRSGIQRLFLRDDGIFIFNAVKSYKSLEHIAYFQMMVASSLLAINDFCDEETILKIVYAVMFLPMNIDMFAGALFDMEMASCERFMERHSVSEAKLSEFRDACQKAAAKFNKGSDAQKSSESGSLDDMVKEMHTAEDPTDKIVIWTKLSKQARRMASNDDLVHKAEALSFELLKVIDEDPIWADDSMKEIMKADVYTTLGVVYKTLKDWEKDLYYDELSLDIYKTLYEKNPTVEMFKKYRERVYNVANVTEAWALTEKTNAELWSRTKDRYEACYTLELIAVSKGLSERDVLQSSSTIISLGTALVNMGRYEEGMDKYNEGIEIIKSLAKNNRNVDLYTELSIILLDCIYQLLSVDNKKAAYGLSANISSYLSFVVKSDFPELINKINDICCAFSNKINDIIRQYHDGNDLDGQMISSRILCDIYEAILPVAPFEVKANIIITRCNICAILFWNLQDYSKAYDEYQSLLKLVVDNELAAPNESGRYMDEANARLADAYTRSLICLERLGRDDELKDLLEKATEWSEFFADHLNAVQGDVPYVLFEMSRSLMRNKSPMGVLLLMMSFNALAEGKYNKNIHPETAKMIIAAMSELSGGNNEEE